MRHRSSSIFAKGWAGGFRISNLGSGWTSERKKSAAEAALLRNQWSRLLFARGVLELVDGCLVVELVGQNLFRCMIITRMTTVADLLGRNHEAV